MRPKLLPGIGWSPPFPKPLLVAYNGASSFSPGNYHVGFAASTDYATWRTQGLTRIAAGSGWESTHVKDPWLIWDGTQYVCFYDGYDGTKYQIGRATSPSINLDWTKYASNPIISAGTVGDPDVNGCVFATVWYDPADTPKWRMWYTGNSTGWTVSAPASTVCYADSSDGLTWTKHGTVIGLGTTGTFNDFASFIGAIYKSGSTWYVYMGGFHSYSGTLKARGGWCTCTDPSDHTTYTTPTEFTNYTGDITIGSDTFISNQPRAIVANPNGTGYLCFVDLWNGSKEACAQVASTDLTSWAAPTALMLPFDDWSSISAENPSVMQGV